MRKVLHLPAAKVLTYRCRYAHGSLLSVARYPHGRGKSRDNFLNTQIFLLF